MLCKGREPQGQTSSIRLRSELLIGIGAIFCFYLLSYIVLAQELLNPTAYRVTYSVIITNVSCQMNTLEIWIPNPIEWFTQHDISVESATPVGCNSYVDSMHGNGIRHWLIDAPPVPGESLTVTQVFTYIAYDVSYDVDPQAIGAYDPTGNLYQTYTISEDKIESAHPDIQATAWSVVGAETNPYEKAQLLYAWVIDHLTYQNTPGFNGALLTLYNGYGECGDYVTLFCALLRAVGVPARPVVGWIAETGRSHHVWAEFYLPSYGWIPADPSWDDGNASWKYFGALPSSDRLISSVGVNIELAPDWTANLFQTFSWRWWGISGDRSTDCSILVEEIELGTASIFRVDDTGDVYADGAYYGTAFSTGSADVAEWVSVSESVEAGDVLDLDVNMPGAYRLSQTVCSSLVAGIVSTEPGVTLGGDGAKGQALLALIGIVPVKVTNEGGPIQPGDLLVTSSTPGYAMRWAGPEPCLCSLVGKALEPMTDEAGVILVLLTAH